MIPPLHLLAAKLAQASYITDEACLKYAFTTLGVLYDSRIVSEECTTILASMMEGSNPRKLVVIQGTRFSENTDLAEIADNLELDPYCPLGLKPGDLVAPGYFEPAMEQLPLIAGFMSMDIPVFVIGHSMGGVRAHLMAAMLAGRGYLATAISFGAPKGASEQFWQDYPAAHVRYVNEIDFAPDWPWLFGGASYHPCPMEWLHGDKLIANGAYSRPTVNYSVADHSIDAYVAKITAFMELI